MENKNYDELIKRLLKHTWNVHNILKDIWKDLWDTEQKIKSTKQDITNIKENFKKDILLIEKNLNIYIDNTKKQIRFHNKMVYLFLFVLFIAFLWFFLQAFYYWNKILEERTKYLDRITEIEKHYIEIKTRLDYIENK